MELLMPWEIPDKVIECMTKDLPEVMSGINTTDDPLQIGGLVGSDVICIYPPESDNWKFTQNQFADELKFNVVCRAVTAMEQEREIRARSYMLAYIFRLMLINPRSSLRDFEKDNGIRINAGTGIKHLVSEDNGFTTVAVTSFSVAYGVRFTGEGMPINQIVKDIYDFACKYVEGEVIE
jgi:hypothetical protein